MSIHLQQDQPNPHPEVPDDWFSERAKENGGPCH